MITHIGFLSSGGICTSILADLFSKFTLVAPRSKRVTIAIAGALGLTCIAEAAGLRVLMADEGAADAEFVQQLSDTRDVDSRFERVRLPIDLPRVTTAEVGVFDDERANVRVRTRGIGFGKLPETIVTVAVGAAASRATLEQPGEEPIVLAMLIRLDDEGLKPVPAFRRTDRRAGVLLREPAMADQLALVNAVLPGKRRLGVVATVESKPPVREL